MASTAATWSPSSLQLRLALHSRNPPAILVRSRFNKLNRPVRLLCVAQHGERRRSGRTWIRSDSNADTFSGWSGSDSNDNGEQAIESQRKKWFGGIVGAGLAGVVLFAGITLAALSLNKRSSLREQQQMEPLTTEHEVSLDSDSKDDQVEEGGFEDSSVNQNDASPDGETGINKDLSYSSEYDEVPTENKIGSDSETIGSNAIDNAPIQEDLQDDVSVVPVATPSSPKSSENQVVDFSIESDVKDSEASPDIVSPEPSSEAIEENTVNDEPTNLSNPVDLSSDYQEALPGSDISTTVPAAMILSVHSDTILKPEIPKDDVEVVASPLTKDTMEFSENAQVSGQRISSFPEVHNLDERESSETSLSEPTNPLSHEKETHLNENSTSRSFFESSSPESSFSPAGIPAPSAVSAALQVLPGKVLVPAVVDQVQGQALAALQVLKVIEADAQPGDLCTRREYARWLVSASSALSRNTVSKVYPAMYIENVTELAYDDITPEDPDFSFIQGLAEAGLISSKLSHRDLLNEEPDSFCFSPQSPLSRQDLVSWKMALEKRLLPEADRKILYQLSGFIDIDKINPDAWPALVADLSAGEQGIIALAFGCTRLFQPDKPVTKAQAAVALSTGEASDLVGEELARIEAESAAENAVSEHNALVAEVEKDINASFEKELSMEREKIDAVEKMAEEARQELERLRAEREGDKLALIKERASIESEMDILSKLRSEVEEQLESLMSNKVEISYEKERINKLREDAEHENQEIARLQHELEVERKALSMARAWAEDEAKRAREQAKVLEEARERWERHGIKVVVSDDLREESASGVTWLNASKQYYVEGTVNRAQGLVDKLKVLAADISGKSREIIDKIIQKILHFISLVKESASRAGTRAGELKNTSVEKARELKKTTIQKARESAQEFQQSTAELRSTFKDGAKRVAGDCREGVEKLTQRFKT